MKVAVFGTSVSSDFVPVLQEFFQFLKWNHVEVQIFKPFFQFLKEQLNTEIYYSGFFESHEDFDSENEFIFSVGGDGTFLHSVMNIRNFDIPARLTL